MFKSNDMNRTLLTFILFCSLCCSQASGQYNRPENRVWAMGNNSGAGFSGTSPSPIYTSIKSGEGCASVCNGTGTLLFYTDGSQVWNASGSLMPNGQNITGAGISSTFSATQGALIVPDLKRCGIYYIFSIASSTSAMLYCNRLNMALAGGQGDVDTSFYLRHKPLIDTLSEKMIAIKSREKNATWIVVHHISKPEFYAYALSATGLDTVPVTSVAGTTATYFTGVMKANPVTDEIAVCNQAPGSGLALYNFDGASGSIVFNKMIDSTAAVYGGTFSPDGSKFYAREVGGTANVAQYNLANAYPALTKTVVGQSKLSDMKLAVNGKIYFSSFAGLNDDKYYLGAIENPNNAGTACQFRDSVPGLFFPLITPGITRLGLGLPNEVVGAPVYTVENEVVYDRKYCSFPASGIVFQAESGFSNYLWDNGATGTSRAVNQAGTYWVTYNTYCGPQTDTYKVAVAGLSPLSITYANGILSVPSNYSAYQWYRDGQSIPGANLPSYTVTALGLYSVVVHKEALCMDSAAYHVTDLTGTNDLELQQRISIFPNPAQDHIYINTTDAVNYNLYSIEGKIILRGRGTRVNVQQLAGGLYLLKLTDKEGRYPVIHKVRIK